MAIISLIGILIGLAFFIFLAMKDVPMILAAPAAAIVVALFSIATSDPLGLLTKSYMEKFGGFATTNFLIFLLSSTFGKLLGDSGAAQTIAVKYSGLVRKAPQKYQKFVCILTIIALSTLFVYGGVSNFVIVFTLIPIAKSLFEEMNVPWKFYFFSHLGSGVLAMGMLPGTPTIQNLTAGKLLKTPPTAAPTLSIITAIASAILGIAYVAYELWKADKKQEGFLPSGEKINELDLKQPTASDFSLIRCLLPSIAMLILLNVTKLPPELALFLSNIFIVVCFPKQLIPHLVDSLFGGANNAVRALMSACSVVGFGGVAGAVVGYKFVTHSLLSIPGPPLLQVIISVNILAGITGSALGGLSMGLDQFAAHWLSMGIPAPVLHRVSVIACSGLDSLPHNTSLVNDLNVTRLTHRQAYKYYFIISGLLPIIMAFFATFLYTAFGIS